MTSLPKQLLNSMKYCKARIDNEFTRTHRVIYFENGDSKKYFIVCVDGRISKPMTRSEARNAIKHESFETLHELKHKEKTIEYNNAEINKYNYMIINITINNYQYHIYKQDFIYKVFNSEYKFKTNDVIDHINGIKTINSINNLRLLTKQQNSLAYYQEQKEQMCDLNDVKDEFIDFYTNKNFKDIGKCINEFNELKYIGYTDNVHLLAYDILKNIRL